MMSQLYNKQNNTIADESIQNYEKSAHTARVRGFEQELTQDSGQGHGVIQRP